jgi:hypothetical protein
MPDIIHPDIWVISIFMKLPPDDLLETSRTYAFSVTSGNCYYR